MYFAYFLLLATITNIHGYKPKRNTQSSTNGKNLKSSNSEPHSELRIPARYKMASNTNYDPALLHNSAADYFPEVEYPESIVDSSKPFYVSASPFPDDVKSSFKSLTATGNGKPKCTIDYSWVKNVNQSERSQEKLPSTSENEGVNDVTTPKGSEINSNDKGSNETLQKDITDDTAFYGTQGLDYNVEKFFTNWSSADQSTEYPDTDYVLGFIIDMDTFMKNLTCLETTGFNEGNNVTLGSECTTEFASAVYSYTNNNDSIIEFNGNSFLTGEDLECKPAQTFEESNLSDIFNISSLLQDDTKASLVDDMQSEFCSIGEFANETNSSCTGN